MQLGIVINSSTFNYVRKTCAMAVTPLLNATEIMFCHREIYSNSHATHPSIIWLPRQHQRSLISPPSIITLGLIKGVLLIQYGRPPFEAQSIYGTVGTSAMVLSRIWSNNQSVVPLSCPTGVVEHPDLLCAIRALLSPLFQIWFDVPAWSIRCFRQDAL